MNPISIDIDTIKELYHPENFYNNPEYYLDLFMRNIHYHNFFIFLYGDQNVDINIKYEIIDHMNKYEHNFANGLPSEYHPFSFLVNNYNEFSSFDISRVAEKIKTFNEINNKKPYLMDLFNFNKCQNSFLLQYPCDFVVFGIINALNENNLKDFKQFAKLTHFNLGKMSSYHTSISMDQAYDINPVRDAFFELINQYFVDIEKAPSSYYNALSELYFCNIPEFKISNGRLTLLETFIHHRSSYYNQYVIEAFNTYMKQNNPSDWKILSVLQDFQGYKKDYIPVFNECSATTLAKLKNIIISNYGGSYPDRDVMFKKEYSEILNYINICLDKEQLNSTTVVSGNRQINRL